ncbi:MAG: DUF4199 domain-containing protein [Bacteroidia bacterium]|nr:DUF4199 domain-containing protein [Bacteroidia bacterium]
MNTNLKFGLLLGVSIAAINLAGHFSEITYGKSATFLMIPILGVAIFAYIKAMSERRENELGGAMTYGQAVGTGAMVTLIATLVIALQTAILHMFQGDYITELQIANLETQWMEAGVPDEQIEQTIDLMENFMNPVFAVISALFSGMFSGMVVVLIVSIFQKRDAPLDGQGSMQ